MKEMVLGLAPAKAYLGIHFGCGTELDDPKGLLQGTSKTARHAKVASQAD